MAKDAVKKTKSLPYMKKAKKRMVKAQLDNLKPFQKGKSGNPKGRPEGQRNYATIYKEALKDLAKQRKTTPEKLEMEFVQQGMIRGFNGDYRFFQDTLDRIHDKPKSRTELTGPNGEPLIPDKDRVADSDDVINTFLNGKGYTGNTSKGKPKR